MLEIAPQPFNQPFFINLTQALGLATNNFNPGDHPAPRHQRDQVRAGVEAELLIGFATLIGTSTALPDRSGFRPRATGPPPPTHRKPPLTGRRPPPPNLIESFPATPTRFDN